MTTKALMIASSFFMGFAGIAFTFLPQEIIQYFGSSPDERITIFIQLAGALYLGFSLMNWMAKKLLIGGIYARPLAMGNFLHFFAGAFAIAKGMGSFTGSMELWIAAVIYFFFAISFGLVIFTHPIKAK